MTDSPLKEYSEFYVKRKGNVEPIVVVTKYKDALACIYFLENIKREMIRKGYIRATSDLMNFGIDSIADAYYKERGIRPLNYLLKNKTFSYFVPETADKNIFTQEKFSDSDILLETKTKLAYVDFSYENMVGQSYQDMCVCETLDDIFDSIDKVRYNFIENSLTEELERRISFLNRLYKFAYEKLSHTVKKTDSDYLLYYPVYEWFETYCYMSGLKMYNIR